ncbi:DUF4184 family protein [Streptomyces sp. LP05-1]|uniref:DUF4184 family protein n=1 Tax=Streptomyces pyxinae TaxID=2970734 RepID=A0ABT2CJA9_9ACTN|nr:DUF4184 family protein [Streptomyces sp. LP05-1]MCS0637380.1 DUF4184 family protein [Streptomyces sp. LP05-1]
MPFTLSHAAAVLPAMRRNGTGRGPLVASALLAGSFAPDVTYFADSVIPGAMAFGTVTHGLPGVVTVDAAIAFALLGAWLLVREPLVGLLPARWRDRVYSLVRGRGRGAGSGGRRGLVAALWVYVSAVLGAVTHVVWDAFTHPGRWGVRLVPALEGTAAGLPVYTYVQYGSSALALVALVWFTAGALRRANAGAEAAGTVPVRLPRAPRPVAVLLLGGGLAAGTLHRCLRWYAYWGRIETPLDIVPTACFGAGTGLAAGVLLYAAVARLRYPRGTTVPTAPEDAGRGGRAAAPERPGPPGPSPEHAGDNEDTESVGGR